MLLLIFGNHHKGLAEKSLRFQSRLKNKQCYPLWENAKKARVILMFKSIKLSFRSVLVLMKFVKIPFQLLSAHLIPSGTALISWWHLVTAMGKGCERPSGTWDSKGLSVGRATRSQFPLLYFGPYRFFLRRWKPQGSVLTLSSLAHLFQW